MAKQENTEKATTPMSNDLHHLLTASRFFRASYREYALGGYWYEAVPFCHSVLRALAEIPVDAMQDPQVTRWVARETLRWTRLERWAVCHAS